LHFPDDENGDVLRRMAASHFNFDVPHDVDFFALFSRGEDAATVAKLLIADAQNQSLAAVKTSEADRGGTELKVVKRMFVTHENVTAFELLLGRVCTRHGGELDGWGVMQDEITAMETRLDTSRDELDGPERDFVDGIRQNGWMHTNALDEDDKPGFSFTTGFSSSIGHPELIVFKMDKKVAHDIFWLLYRCAQNGKPVPPGRRTGGILPDDDGYVFPVAKRHYANYLGWSRWFYRGDDFDCLQIVWPDEAGVFPWEDGFDIKYAGLQVDLTENGWAAEAADRAG
jgi:hypothetical protein